MNRLLIALLLGIALIGVQGSRGGVSPAAGQDARADGQPRDALPVGKWKVEFANGVKEVVRVGDGGESSVVEPLRQSDGKAEVRGGSVVITFDDNRVERWTPVGSRYVVEHWFPASQVPVATAVLGIAERGK